MIIKKVYKGLTPFVKGYKGDILLFEEGGLPSAYQQVEYIQSTSNNLGDNYIDTGLYCDEHTVIEMECMFDSSFQDYGRVFGDMKYGDGIEVLGMESFNSMTFRYGNQGNTYSRSLDGLTRYKISLGNKKLYIDDHLRMDWSAFTYVESTDTLKIFSSNEDRDGAYKLYSFKVYQDGVLVRDFVPCFIKATDESGLYDLVTKQFYHNLGTVPFIHPTPIPSPYTRIEYIQTSGTQYIDTGIQPTLDTSMELGVYMLEETGDTVVGNTLGGGDRDYHDWHIFNYSGSVLWDCAENRAWTGTFSPNQYYDFECGNNYVIQDGNEIYRDSDSTWSIDTFNILIFGQNCIFPNSQHYDTDLNMAFSIGRIYYLKIYEDGTLVRNLIPVRNGQVGGMYDAVSGQFFGNEGSGDFILGGDI